MNYEMKKCIHPFMKQRENKLIKSRLQQLMRKQGFDYLILQHSKDIFYVTGYQPIVGTSFAVVPPEGEVTLVISTLESQDAWCCTEDVIVKEFMSWVFIDDGTPESWKDKGEIMNPDDPIRLTLASIDFASIQGNIGYEEPMMSHGMYQKLTEKIPADKLKDCTGLLNLARMHKTPWEISMVKRAAQQLEQVYEAVGAELKPGMPEYMIQQAFVKYSAEFDTWGMLGRANSFIPAVGPYYGLNGMPRGYILQEGDIVKFDVGFPYLGFNSDIARTYAVGKASKEAEEIYDVLYHANRLAVSMMKPGVKCCEVYRAAREYVEEHSRYIRHYPRGHMGHSVGCGLGAEEYPQLSANLEVVLEEGMTFSVETPYSATGLAAVHGGFNLEDTLVITKDGHEAFTELPDNLYGKKATKSYCPPERTTAAIEGAILVKTPEESFVPLQEMLGGKPTALLFLRFFGCKLARYEVEMLRRQYAVIAEGPGQVIVVVQSGQGVMLQELSDQELPFRVICDREGKLYEKFHIPAGADKESIAGEMTQQKLAEAEKLGLVHGYDEGQPLQLPGVVYFNSKGIQTETYLAKEAGDVPTAEELAMKLRTLD